MNLLLSTGMMLLLAVPAQFGRVNDGPTIFVNGDAEVEIVPDKIFVRLGIETSDKDLLTARAENIEILGNLLSAAGDLGIAEEEIQTSHLSIRPQWRSWQEDDNFIGYFARNSVTITLSDIEKIEPLMTAVLEAGVTHVLGVDLRSAAFESHRAQARELALLDARNKAEAMAAALGQSIGRPLDIRESRSGYSTPNPQRDLYTGDSAIFSGGGFGGQQGSAEPPVSMVFGTIPIRASVSVIFELAD